MSEPAREIEGFGVTLVVVNNERRLFLGGVLPL
jgi:hypothetical protein